MKIIHLSFRHLATATILLAGLGLSLSMKAQSFTGQSALTESTTRLRSIITPVTNSSVIQIRFENEGYGTVRMLIRDKKGKILFDESQPKRKYAGQFDLASLPSGLYIIELSTSDALCREMIRIDAPVSSRVVTLSTSPEEKLIVKQDR